MSIAPNLPAKRGINRAPHSRHSAPAALVVEALATEGLPQADPPRFGAKLGGHLGGSLLDLLHQPSPYPGGGEDPSSPQLVVGRGPCLVLGKEDAPPISHVMTSQHHTNRGRCMYPETQLVIFNKKLYRCLVPRARKRIASIHELPRRGLLGNLGAVR